MVTSDGRKEIKDFLISLAKVYPDWISHGKFQQNYSYRSFSDDDLKKLVEEGIVDIESWPTRKSMQNPPIIRKNVYRLSPIKGWNYILSLETNKMNRRTMKLTEKMTKLTRILTLLGIGSFAYIIYELILSLRSIL